MNGGLGLDPGVAGALERCGTRLVRRGPSEWSFDLGNGEPFPVRAQRQQGWLRLLASPRDSGEGEDPWCALCLNAALPGGVRLVRHPPPVGLVLQADLLLEEPLVAQRLQALCGALHIAGMPECQEAGPAVASEADEGADAALAELARERGWQLELKDGNRFAAELDAPGMLSLASVERRDGGLCLWIEVLRSAALSEASRRAAGLFLLSLTAELRLVRGAASRDPAPAIRLEAHLPAVPTASELDLALAALSLACRLCSRELRGLTEEELARTYLDQRPKED